jgi:hypothetical protein
MKQVKRLIGIAVGCCILASCSPSRMFMVGTNGIATYNRHTGQFEILWEYAEKPLPTIHDTIYVDSCRIKDSF